MGRSSSAKHSALRSGCVPCNAGTTTGSDYSTTHRLSLSVRPTVNGKDCASAANGFAAHQYCWGGHGSGHTGPRTPAMCSEEVGSPANACFAVIGSHNSRSGALGTSVSGNSVEKHAGGCSARKQNAVSHELDAGCALDALIAEKVMGQLVVWRRVLESWRATQPDGQFTVPHFIELPCTDDIAGADAFIHHEGDRWSAQLPVIPRYSMDIAAAW